MIVVIFLMFVNVVMRLVGLLFQGGVMFMLCFSWIKVGCVMLGVGSVVLIVWCCRLGLLILFCCSFGVSLV